MADPHIPSPASSGGQGQDFERRVASLLVCSAICSFDFLGHSKRPFRTVSLQAGHTGAEIEDIVVEEYADEDRGARTFISVKMTISPTAANKEFGEVITRSWLNWKNEDIFEQELDSIMVAASTSKSPNIRALLALTEVARASASHSDFESRLQLKKYHAKKVRELLPVVLGLIMDLKGTIPSGAEVWRFLCKVRVATFDLEQENSQDYKRVVALLMMATQNREKATAVSLWNAVFNQVSSDAGRAKIYTRKDFESWAKEYGINQTLSPRSESWMKSLREHCQRNRSRIAQTVGSPGLALKRDLLRDELVEALDNERFVLVKGPAGCGKSSLAISAAEQIAAEVDIYTFQGEEFTKPHIDEVLQTAGLKEVSLSEWQAILPFRKKVLLIESVERLLETATTCLALEQLFDAIRFDNSWVVVLTCRDYLSDHVQDHWGRATTWSEFEVPLLTIEEVREVTEHLEISNTILEQEIVIDAFRNLKLLDYSLRSIQVGGSDPTSVWTSQKDWREHVWRRLLKPQTMPKWQMLLKDLSRRRILSAEQWVEVKESQLETAAELVGQGVLVQKNATSSLFRSEHDLLEDWSMLESAKDHFERYSNNPAVLFESLGDHLMVRRSFRQFLGELADGDDCSECVDFLSRVWKWDDCPKFWRFEMITAILGASSAKGILSSTEGLWFGGSWERFDQLHRVLKSAYRRRAASFRDTELPVGPGWGAVLSFVVDQGDVFVRNHVREVTELLFDWHFSVVPENDSPGGLRDAAQLVMILWEVASNGEKRFGDYWESRSLGRNIGDDCLKRLVCAVAAELPSVFFHRLSRDVKKDRDDHSYDSDNFQKISLYQDVLQFLTIDHNGWVLARAYPRTMVRLCLETYGLRERQNEAPMMESRGLSVDSGLRISSSEFSEPSALCGPFFELLKSHAEIGKPFILELINVATGNYFGVRSFDDVPQNKVIEFPIGDWLARQGGDQDWWSAYRGLGGLHSMIEAALMALEKWLLEDIAIKRPDDLPLLLQDLLLECDNIAISGMVCSVAGANWWTCGEVIASLFKVSAFVELDRRRMIQEQTNLRAGNLLQSATLFTEERSEASKLSHRKSQLEDFVFIAQFGTGMNSIQAVIDEQLREVEQFTEDEANSEEVKMLRVKLHRVDRRNAIASPADDQPGYQIVQASEPPKDLQDFLNESEAEWAEKMKPANLQHWAEAILSPLPSSVPRPENWKVALNDARSLGNEEISGQTERAFGKASLLVAAVCVRYHWSEMDRSDQDWCFAHVDQLCANCEGQSSADPWQMFGKREESIAISCFVLLLNYLDESSAKRSSVLRLIAAALTHFEKDVRKRCADVVAELTGEENLVERSCWLLITYSRQLRSIDRSFRGPGGRVERPPQVHWHQLQAEMNLEKERARQKLCTRFVTDEWPGEIDLSHYYPRGEEEEENLPILLTVLIRSKVSWLDSFLARVGRWCFIQECWNSRGHWAKRKFAADSWRHRKDSRRVGIQALGDVEKLLSMQLAGLPDNRGYALLIPVFDEEKFYSLSGSAHKVLQQLSLSLEKGGSPIVFWSAWDECFLICLKLHEKLLDGEKMKAAGMRSEQLWKTYSGLQSVLFLNEMYFRPDFEWPFLNGYEGKIKKAFAHFQMLAQGSFIRFLGTVGGKLLPDAFTLLSKVILFSEERTGKHFLTPTEQAELLRIISGEIKKRRIASSDSESWAALSHLLGVLVDEGASEAFRLREVISRRPPSIISP